MEKNNKKTIINVALIGGVLFIAYKLFDKFFSKQNTKKRRRYIKGL